MDIIEKSFAMVAIFKEWRSNDYVPICDGIRQSGFSNLIVKLYVSPK